MVEGLDRKYVVNRVDDPAGKHSECEYFVLDLTHDPIARLAAGTYAHTVREDNPELFRELSHRLFVLSGWCTEEEADAWKAAREARDHSLRD